MWLVLDIGNSAAKGGFFSNGQVHAPFRIKLNRTATQDAWSAALAPHLNDQAVTHIGIASVVPETTARLCSLFEDRSLPVDVIHHQMRLPFDLAYETPHTLGTDRLAAAAAAWIRYGLADPNAPRAVVALDAGTAVTYEVVDSSGTFLGGIIG
ncbi:MAG TPA: type III pantothenate kinase, partial [Rhodothermales bacterium]|nr:type III pantothenate kinase [Rhodothermales bacterium]